MPLHSSLGNRTKLSQKKKKRKKERVTFKEFPKPSQFCALCLDSFSVHDATEESDLFPRLRPNVLKLVFLFTPLNEGECWGALKAAESCLRFNFFFSDRNRIDTWGESNKNRFLINTITMLLIHIVIFIKH